MKYVCTMCGYIYDEDVEGTKFNDLPDTWTCPLCGAPKDAFELMEEKTNAPKEEKKEEKKEEINEVNEEEDLTELSYGELAGLFTSLARGAEKQYLADESKYFKEIATYFEKNNPNDGENNINVLSSIMNDTLVNNFISYRNVATLNQDRGSLRAITWGEKVTKLAKGLVDRYIKDGDKFLKDTHIFICTVCGFIYVGEKAPEVCPICKVPGFKFEEIKGGK